jgi:hypothetical protein
MAFTPFPGFCETYLNICNGDARHNIVLYYDSLGYNTPCREEALADKETRAIRQKRRFDAIIAAVKIVIAYQQSWNRCKAWVFCYQKYLQQKFLRRTSGVRSFHCRISCCSGRMDGALYEAMNLRK